MSSTVEPRLKRYFFDRRYFNFCVDIPVLKEETVDDNFLPMQNAYLAKSKVPVTLRQAKTNTYFNGISSLNKCLSSFFQLA